MDTKDFLAQRSEICRRLDMRRAASLRNPERSGWTHLLGRSLLTGLRLTLGGERRVGLASWLPRLLVTVAAPALVGFLRDGGLPFWKSRRS